MKQFFGKGLTTILPLLFVSACGGGGGSSASDSSSSNRAPEFVSGSTATIAENSSGTLLTLSANDPDGDSIIYSLAGGADQSHFLIDNGNLLRFGIAPNFENPADVDKDNVYRITIEARDGNGGKSSQEIVITVIDINDGVPEFSSATQVAVEEGVNGIFYTAMAQDSDGGKIKYSLIDGIDSAFFSIDSASGELSFNTAPDFESPTDSDKDNHYDLVVSANDGEGGENQLSLQVIVTNLTKPSARIVFPTGGANMGGKLSSVALTAKVLDLESGENSFEQLASMTLDHQSMIEDTTHPSLWYLDSSLRKGRSSYIFSAQFLNGETVQDHHFVKNELFIEYPVAVSYEEFRRSRYFADSSLDAIFEIDGTGTRRVISGPSVGSGPALNPIDMIKQSPTEQANPADDYFIVLNGNGSIYSVQRSTGDRTQLSTWVPADLTALALTSYGDAAYTTRATGSRGEIIKFDLLNGGYSVISSPNSRGAGVDMISPVSIALDEANGQLYVGDFKTKSILKVDIASGNRTTISGNGIGSGESIYQPVDLIVDVDSGQIYVVNGGAQNILQVDMATGNRAVVTDWDKGEGLRLVNPWSISRDADGDRLLVSGIQFDPVIMSVDISTGDRKTISSNHVGRGPSYRWHKMSYSRATDQLLAIAKNGLIVAEIDLQNGNRTIAADFETPGFTRVQPSIITSDDTGRYAYIFDENSVRLVKADLETADVEFISTSYTGEGPAFSDDAEAMDLDIRNNRMVLLQASGLLSVDLDSGDREFIFDNQVDTAPVIASANGFALDLANNRALISDYGTGGIWQVDLATGSASTFVSSVHGGSTDQYPLDVVLDSVGNRLLVGTTSGNLVAIDLDDLSQSTLSSGRGCDSDCRGEGIAVTRLDSMAIDVDGRRLFAYDSGEYGVEGVVVIDLRSGQRALASK
ncbi:Ig-like domain-containing protein [Microbulbifer sp. EKSA008]|uniref:Ig-like domain-containing protein n=1 Tax=Microbulbifer sp. EKSA008 TaxID=3243367 RepID=UPI0040420757